MIPLKITAHTPAGYAASDPWSPALDGILAYVVMRERLGDDFGLAVADDGQMEPVEGLPFAVERHGDWWWYACSAPMATPQRVYRRHYHRRFDQAHAERYTTASKVLLAAGPYKGSRLAHRVRVAPSVTWHCIGDRIEIRRLLDRVTHVGRGFASGLGQVAEWDVVEDDASEEPARRHRPLPEDYAVSLGLDGPRLVWGIRPPARIRANCTLCVMPEGAHAD